MKKQLDKFSKQIIFLFFIVALLTSCNAVPPTELKLANLHVPEGYAIEVYAEVPNARSLTKSPDGTVFVGNRKGGGIYAVIDKNKDYKADTVIQIKSELNVPNGVAFKDGNLYVAEVDRILSFKDIESSMYDNPDFTVVTDKYPDKSHHGWKYIAFGPDGQLYVPVGAPCNICKSEDEIFASITRVDVKTGAIEQVVEGVRNSVGFDWNPNDNKMWFTDNGRDMMGDDLPPCELNVVLEENTHFGYPYCHAGSIVDPEFGKQDDCDKYEKPAQSLNAHVAPLGMKFVKGEMFSKFNNDILIAEHGSWNRSKKSGYQISKVVIEDNKGVEYKPFIYGWLDEEAQTSSGRPVDLLFLDDGSLLISDDYAGLIYRVSKN